jgi:hypothetical protein
MLTTQGRFDVTKRPHMAQPYPLWEIAENLGGRGEWKAIVELEDWEPDLQLCPTGMRICQSSED